MYQFFGYLLPDLSYLLLRNRDKWFFASKSCFATIWWYGCYRPLHLYRILELLMAWKWRRGYWLFVGSRRSFVRALDFGKFQLLDGRVEKSGVIKSSSRGRKPFRKVITGVKSTLLQVVASVGAWYLPKGWIFVGTRDITHFIITTQYLLGKTFGQTIFTISYITDEFFSKKAQKNDLIKSGLVKVLNNSNEGRRDVAGSKKLAETAKYYSF